MITVTRYPLIFDSEDKTYIASGKINGRLYVIEADSRGEVLSEQRAFVIRRSTEIFLQLNPGQITGDFKKLTITERNVTCH